MTNSEAASTAEDAAAAVENHPAMRAMVKVGLIAYGLVHVLVGWIALQVAWGGDQEQADQKGALEQLASTPVGTPLLWVLATGLFALALWQLTQVLWGHRDKGSSRERLARRGGSAARVVVYAGLAVAAVKMALGASSSSTDAKQQGLTARLMGAPLGRIAVAVIGLVVIGVGIFSIVKGVRKSFTRDLGQSATEPLLRLGQAGYLAKGAAIGAIGGLFVWSAATYDPKKAGGLDAALRTVAAAPVGPYLLTLIAVGLLCFGIYCFFWARNPQH